MVDLERLKRLEAAATPGEWFFDQWVDGPHKGEWAITCFGDALLANVHAVEPDDGFQETGPDHEFIVALRNAAPAIIAELEELRKDKARIDGLEAEMKREPLVLHDCSGSESWPSRMRGLGLIPSKPRTLRQSLDSMLQLPQPAPEVKP